METRRAPHQDAARQRARLLAAAAVAAVTCHWLRPERTSGPAASAALAMFGFSFSFTPEIIVSRLLSLGVVAGSLIGKFPQVYAICKARSAAGVSAVSVWMEMMSLGVQFAYNVVRRTPVTTYAEVPIVFLQVHVLALTVAWADGNLGPCVWAGCLGLMLLTAAMALQLIPAAVTAALYGANMALSVAIIGPQLVLTCKNRSTGQLSLVVVGMTFSGLTTRLYTTLVEVEDAELRLSICLNWLLMAVMLLQFLFFRPRPPLPKVPEIGEDGLTESLAATPKAGDEARREALLRRQEASHTSLVDCASKIGSHRCLYLLGNEVQHPPGRRSIWPKSNSLDSFNRHLGSSGNGDFHPVASAMF